MPTGWRGPSYGLFDPDGTPVSQHELLRDALAGNPLDDIDLVVRNAGVPDGRVLNFSATTLPSAGTDGARDVVVVFRDVTARHRTEQALADALATEQAAGRAAARARARQVGLRRDGQP